MPSTDVNNNISYIFRFKSKLYSDFSPNEFYFIEFSHALSKNLIDNKYFLFFLKKTAEKDTFWISLNITYWTTGDVVASSLDCVFFLLFVFNFKYICEDDKYTVLIIILMWIFYKYFFFISFFFFFC